MATNVLPPPTPPTDPATSGGDGFVDDRFSVLSLVTPDGSGQTVHPDYVRMPESWPGNREYLLITPYPNGNAAWENPSIFAGSGSGPWNPPTGVINPIARPGDGYLSDPDAVAVPETGELWVYYRSVTYRNEIYLIRSRDGVRYDSPTLVVSAPNHDVVSPTVVRRAPDDWLMWSVKSGVGCMGSTTTVELRRSTNGIDWSKPEPVALSQPDFSPWHIEVQWLPTRGEFWAVFNGKRPGGCTTQALFIATSHDGLHWTTYPSPILVRGKIPELADVVYRSTFSYDPESDVVDFWYSGARYIAPNYVWGSAHQRRTRRDVFATANQRTLSSAAAIAPDRDVPPLTNPP